MSDIDVSAPSEDQQIAVLKQENAKLNELVFEEKLFYGLFLVGLGAVVAWMLREATYAYIGVFSMAAGLSKLFAALHYFRAWRKLKPRPKAGKLQTEKT